MTSARLCTEDQVGTETTSASASRITSGGASMTTSRDACTATTSKLATEEHSRSLLLGNAAIELARRHVAARGEAGNAATNPDAADLRPVDRPGREGHIQGDSRGAR